MGLFTPNVTTKYYSYTRYSTKRVYQLTRVQKFCPFAFILDLLSAIVRSIDQLHDLLKWSIVINILDVRARLVEALHLLWRFILVVNDRFDGIGAALNARHPEWFEWATAINIDLDIFALGARVVQHK